MSQHPLGLLTARNALLTAVGWIALLLYILACRPSWSPDGSKLLVSYYDPDRKEAGVALFDRTTGATRTLLVRPNASSGDKVIPAQWGQSGEHAILWLEEHELLFLPIDSNEPARTLELPGEVEWTGLPSPEVNGSLYFGGDALVKVDIASGEITSSETDREVVLYAAANRIFYLAETEGGAEIGEVDQEELTFEPLFELDEDDLERRGIDQLVGYVAFEPRGRRLALTGRSENGTRIVLGNRAGIDRVIAPQLSAATFVLGNIEWSPTHDTIYAAAFTPTDLEDVTEFSVAEINLNGTVARLTPLGRIQESVSDGESWALSIALSPDGSQIAATTAHYDDDSLSEEDRAVFLVELENPERPVTKIPLPSRGR